MRLLTVELARFWSRRAVAVVLLVAAVLAALLVASAAYSTRPADATETAAARDVYEQELEANQQGVELCREDPEDVMGPGSTEADCEARPQLEWYLPRPVLDLAGEVEQRGTVLVVLLAGASILVAATFAGADWASGSLTNQLVFVPRRPRVWWTKALAVVLSTTAASTLVAAAFWGALHLVARSRGLPTTDATWTLILETSGRGLALVAAAALGSFALTMLLRHTVGTLGLLFGYAVVGEALAASLPFNRMSQWSMSHSIMAWVHDGERVYDESICTDGACDPWYVLTLEHSAAYLGVLLLVAVVASLVAFRARDVA
jgi:ABC-2 type transport system permease protein